MDYTNNCTFILGELIAHEITMGDNDRIALMQMVKEGKISTETALQVVSICASSGENLSSGFLTKRVSNQSPQLQRLVRTLKFYLWQG